MLNFNTYRHDGLELGIVKDTEVLVVALADWTGSDSRTTGSASVIVECGPSEVIWVETSGSAGEFNGNSQRRSHFIGYMLYAY